MANATCVRHSVDRPAGEQERALRELSHEVGSQSVVGNHWDGMPDGERHASLIALATPELDRVYEKVKGFGYALMLMDANGLVLYERSDPSVKEAVRLCPVSTARDKSPDNSETDAPLMVVPVRPMGQPATGKPARETLTLEDLAGEDPQMLRNVRSAYRIADSNVSV